MIALYTDRLWIRDAKWEDLPAHHALLSDPKAMRYLQDIQTHSPEESEENLRQSIEQSKGKDRKLYFLTIESRETGEYIGQTGYTVSQNTPLGKLVDVGYFLLPAFWGQGYAAEALREVLRFAFEEDGVYRVSTGCLRENAASEKVMQKSGLIKEAELLEYSPHEGVLKDRLVYRLLLHEWMKH